MTKIYILFSILFILQQTALTLNNGLGQTPPLGWNSLSSFGCNINEQIIKQSADALVSTGLAAKGYKYIILDDCWANEARNENNQLMVNPAIFSSGIKSLVDYVHSKGLFFGLSSSAGTLTCQNKPGSLTFEDIDIKTFAEWGIDYLKYDNCSNNQFSAKLRFKNMNSALKKTDKKIFFALNNAGQEKVHLWGQSIANSWRTSADIQNNFESIVSILESLKGKHQFSKKGGWNDADVLQVGKSGLNSNETEAHFALWALAKSPLMIGTDLLKLTQDSLILLGNDEILAINQDSKGLSGDVMYQKQGLEVWAAPLQDGDYAICFFNKQAVTETEKSISIKFTDIGILGDNELGEISARDVIKKTDLGTFQDKISTVLAPHSAQLIRLKVISRQKKPRKVERQKTEL